MIAMLTTLLTFYVSQNNIITLLIAIEILLLTVTVKIIYIGGQFNDVESTLYAIFIIGLSLLVSYYRLRGKVSNIL